MLFFIRKRTLFLLSFIFVLLVLTAGVSVRNTKGFEAVTTQKTLTIIVDAGHGEPDGGAVSPRGVLEKDLNVKVAGFLKANLEAQGYRVLLTREGDRGIYDETAATIKAKKNSDMRNRLKIMNDSGADLFVSIHMNQFGDAKYSGPQVFYTKNLPEAKELATHLQTAMISELTPVSKREIKPAGKEIYLLSHAKIPAVLVECGFLSNEKEEALLIEESYQKKIAQAISGGITAYFKERT